MKTLKKIKAECCKATACLRIRASTARVQEASAAAHGAAQEQPGRLDRRQRQRARSRDGLVVIKPSGMRYEDLTAREHGGGGPGRQGRRRQPQAFLGYVGPPVRLSPPPGCERRGAHPFDLCHRLCRGGQADPGGADCDLR